MLTQLPNSLIFGEMLPAVAKQVDVLSQTAVAVSKIESEALRQEISSYAQLIAGLRFKPALIHRVFRGA